MLIKTLLNKCHKFNSFVFENVFFVKYNLQEIIKITIVPRKNSKAICSNCNQTASLYDKLTERYFEFIPIWGIPVYFCYLMRRVNCRTCGIKIEQVPWAKGKYTLTTTYMHYLSSWARHLSWTEVARRFRTTWDKIASAIEYIVEWGLSNRKLNNITAIGVDEIQWKKGHKYLTLVYQINNGMTRLLWLTEDRTEKSFRHFFDFLGKIKCDLIQFVCSDMWKPYIKVIKDKLKGAIHILDRFHIVSMLNKAIDKVRSTEQRKMLAEGYEPILKKSRWCLLKRKENLTEKQEVKLKDLLNYNLKSVRAYLLKEDFQGLWDYVSPTWAGKFLNRWCNRAMRSKIEPIKKIVKSIRKHKDLILNWFKAKKMFSSGIVEGLNNKVKLTMRKSYGFRTYKYIEIALYHALGKLPEPEPTHRFF